MERARRFERPTPTLATFAANGCYRGFGFIADPSEFGCKTDFQQTASECSSVAPKGKEPYTVSTHRTLSIPEKMVIAR